MDSNKWKYDFMFATDIFEKLNEINVVLQGKEVLVNNLYLHVKAFQTKLSLFCRKIEAKNCCYFPLLERKYLKILFKRSWIESMLREKNLTGDSRTSRK